MEIDHSPELIKSFSEEAAFRTSAFIRDPKNNVARIQARTAARNLYLALQDGDEPFFSLVEQSTVSAVVRLLLHLKAFEAVPTVGAISAGALATKLNCESEFIIRLMRMLAAVGIFNEPAPDTYSHNKGSITFLDPTYRALHEIMNDDFFNNTWLKMQEYFDKNPKKSPDDPKHHPYGSALDMDGYDWHEVAARTPESLAKISRAFAGQWSVMRATGCFPFENLEPLSKAAEADQCVFMVDVGGRHGHTLLEITEAYPQLKGSMVCQDLPQIIESTPSGLLPASIVPMAHNFWEPQPVKGAKVYYLRRILHDWPDAECITILKHLADAMTADSIVLITDVIVPDRVQREHTFAYTMDLIMFTFSGKERSKTEWSRLLEESGLELVQVWLTPESPTGVVEGRKRRA